tara:strand:- start:573 stop:2081 length:1509 start_codon:yes stop_codon:yes gene_type:complete
MAHEITVFANFNLKDVKDPESLYYNSPDQTISVLNQLSESETITINENNPGGYKLAISTNGIDGIGYIDDTFNLDDIYYQGQQIYFNVRLKTLNDYPAKNKPRLFLDSSLESEGSLNIELINSLNQSVSASFFTNFGELTSINKGGFFNGYFIPHATGNDLKLKVICNDGQTKIINANSNTFSIKLSTGEYDFRKINEDNDEKANLRNRLFQPNLATNSQFFDNFLGEIVGDKNSDPTGLGIQIYEKIANYVANNTDIETCNIAQLISQLKLVDADVLNYAENYPSTMKRIIDLFSIQISKLIDNKNNFNANFKKYGYENNIKFGKNLGDKISLTDELSGGDLWKPIVIHEVFSDTYSVLNIDPTESFDFIFNNESNKTFSLSSYTKKWPWPLVLPTNFGNNTYFISESSPLTSIDDFLITEDNNRITNELYDYDYTKIEEFYTFYNYVSTIDGTSFNNIIDYKNDLTNISLSSLSSFEMKGGILDDLILRNLYTKTSLLSA